MSKAAPDEQHSTAPAPEPPGWVERLFAIAGGGDEIPASRRLDDFRRFLLLWVAGRSTLWILIEPTSAWALIPLALVAILAAALGFRRSSARWAPRLALPVVLAQVAWHFPYTANHVYLEAVCVLLLALVGGRDAEDDARALAGLRWTAALVLFHTGLQKLFYGLYFQGEFLAFMAGNEERFGRVFRWLMTDADLAHLTALDHHETGAGPYRVSGWLLPAASNAVWVAELVLPVLLMIPRSRVLGALGGLALMVGIQLAALELGFALLFVNLMLLFLPGRWNARMLPFSALLIAWGLAAALGWLPGHPVDWNLM